MPPNASRSTLARLWEMLQLLPSAPPGLTAAQIRERLVVAGYDASKRTIERDLNELSRLFPLQCNSKGTPYGWYWTPGKSANLPGLSISEALTLKLVENSIRPLIPQGMLQGLESRFTQAQEKLAALSPENPAARWPNYVTSVTPNMILLPPKIDPQVLATLQQALLDGRQVEAAYRSAGEQQPKSLTLSPAGLAQRGHTTYLLASSEGFSDIRQYVLHRFTSVRLLDTAGQQPEGFELQDIARKLMQFGQRGAIRLEAWVSTQLGGLLEETPMSEDMQLRRCEAPSGYILTATVTDTWELRWWLLSHAGSIVVRQPMALREDMQSKLQKAVEQYLQTPVVCKTVDQ